MKKQIKFLTMTALLMERQVNKSIDDFLLSIGITPQLSIAGMNDAIFRIDAFCDEDAPDYIQLECGTELGGIIAVGLIKPGTDIGDTDAEIVSFLESEASWTNGIGASPQEMWVIKDTRGTLPAGTPTEEEGYGLVPTERTGDDRESTFEALGVMENRDFVAAINKRRGWGFVYVTAGYDQGQDGYEAFYVPNTSIYMSETIDQSIKPVFCYFCILTRTHARK